MPAAPLRVTLVHDWLTGMRGGEKVLESLCRIFPDADLCTLVHVRGSVSSLIESRRIRTSFVQRLPLASRFYRHYLPLFPAAIEQFNFDDADLVVSTSHCAAKSVVVPGRAVHLCYCHSPMRYAWDQFEHYFGPARVGRLQSALLRPVLACLARWDRDTSHRVTRFLANSAHVAGRIQRYYNRRASVVQPPVDTRFFTPAGTPPSRYFLVVSALVPYKRIDLAIHAAARIGWPLKIVGDGPDRARLQAMAGPSVEFLGALDGDRLRELYRGAQALLMPGEEDFGIAPVESLACGRPVVGLGRGGVTETVEDGISGVLVDERGFGVESLAAGMDASTRMAFDSARLRARAEVFSTDRFEADLRGKIVGNNGVSARMVKRYNRLLVFLYVVSDAVAGALAFLLAYLIRFDTAFAQLVPVTKGTPPFSQYLQIAPFIGILVPVLFHLQGLYRLRRGRTRVDDFFAVMVGSIGTVLVGVASTLYMQTYIASGELRDVGYYQVSQGVWALFLGINIVFTFASRETVRDLLRRRWRAGVGLKRVLIVGAGDLGGMVADRILEHGELGFRLVGFADDRSTSGDAIGHRGLPLLGSVTETAEICLREKVDVIYVALPIEEHVKMLGVVDFATRECIDIHVVPDLLQFIALRARLEDLDGLPIISINDVPLRGINSAIKRVVDLVLSFGVVVVGAIPGLIIAWLIKRSSPGPVFYTQDRMGLDGKSFTVYKFRSMPVDAEDTSGPIFARDNDPRATAIGRWLRKYDVDELPQFWNVLRGDMSIVGPRPERPFFVEQFKHRIPQYMLRHKVKAGITGWAQVNGWRGNTSIEKRIEFDLYYIENWSLSLDIKIMWLTVLRGYHRLA